MTENLPAVVVETQEYLPARMEDVEAVVKRMELVEALMKRSMRAGIDYGVIPGTKSKPTLLKPGAEKVCVMFRLCPGYKTDKLWDGNHLTVEVTCTIRNLDGVALGEASAMCSTKESKYAWRQADRKCPNCGQAAIKRSKYPPRDDPDSEPGWYCFAKVGGCGVNFAADDLSIVGQATGRVENPDIADSYNTVLRIAEKRAYIAAVRLVTGSSALFDEDAPQNDRPDEEQQQGKQYTQDNHPPSPKILEALAFIWRQKCNPEEANVSKINSWLPDIKALPTREERNLAFGIVKKFAEDNQCMWEDSTKQFVLSNPF